MPSIIVKKTSSIPPIVPRRSSILETSLLKLPVSVEATNYSYKNVFDLSPTLFLGLILIFSKDSKF